MIKIIPQARVRMFEQNICEEEVEYTIENGERFNAKYGRSGFRCNLYSKKIGKEIFIA